MTNLSSTFFISKTFPLSLTEHTNFIWKHPVVIVETFKSQSILRFQGIILHNPFARSWCLHLLGNFLVACICAWHHFLGAIGHQNVERVLCLILPSRLVESVSSASILHCQSFLQECISRRGLLHYSEGLVFVLRWYCITEMFPYTKECFQNDKR